MMCLGQYFWVFFNFMTHEEREICIVPIVYQRGLWAQLPQRSHLPQAPFTCPECCVLLIIAIYAITYHLNMFSLMISLYKVMDVIQTLVLCSLVQIAGCGGCLCETFLILFRSKEELSVWTMCQTTGLLRNQKMWTMWPESFRRKAVGLKHLRQVLLRSLKTKMSSP